MKIQTISDGEKVRAMMLIPGWGIRRLTVDMKRSHFGATAAHRVAVEAIVRKYAGTEFEGAFAGIHLIGKRDRMIWFEDKSLYSGTAGECEPVVFKK